MVYSLGRLSPSRFRVNQLQRPYDDIYIFRNLTHLEIHDFWETAIPVLHLCPKLQNLKLCEQCFVENWDGEDDEESWGEPEYVPQCLLSCLTTYNILHFLGLQNELLLAEYILRNAYNLQTTTIKCKREPLKIERKLSQCPKASATCQLSVCLKDTDYVSSSFFIPLDVA
ncbi:putative FBD domain-containing protein [Medicago truncatula]|uniref:Putative FBD domain-containing protein n=1 Tax=Medicago truncatula TaxID=3880 RepID=A0A396J495_MEDTR|nr:putative FBD domain-containing protein [Medicago truncatula]